MLGPLAWALGQRCLRRTGYLHDACTIDALIRCKVPYLQVHYLLKVPTSSALCPLLARDDITVHLLGEQRRRH